MGCAAAVALAASTAHAAEADGTPSGLFGPVHLEVAGRVVVSGPQFAAPACCAPGPLGGGGAGGRLGALYRGFYGGLTYMDYLSEGICLDSLDGSCNSTHAFSYGIEGGYGQSFKDILVARAALGVGDYATMFENTVTGCVGTFRMCSSTTNRGATHSVYLEPQALVGVHLGYVLVALDLSLFYLPSIDSTAGTSTSTFASYRLGFQLGARL